jgi:hypothetical protein
MIDSNNQANTATFVPSVVLRWSSELMWFYPWLMRVSLVLQRLVQ